MDLCFDVINYKLKRTFNDNYPNKSNNYLRLLFNFTTDDWENLNKYIILKNNHNQAFLFDYDSEGVLVPFDVLGGSKLYVSIYRVSDDVRVTTNVVTVYLKESNYTTNYSSITDFDGDIINIIRTHLTSIDDTILGLDDVYAKSSDLRNIESDIENLDKIYSKITDLNDLRSEVDNLDSKYPHKSELNRIIDRIDELDTIYAKISTVEDIESEIDDLVNVYASKSIVEGLRERVIVLESNYSNLNDDVTNLKNSIYGVEEDMLL